MKNYIKKISGAAINNLCKETPEMIDEIIDTPYNVTLLGDILFAIIDSSDMCFVDIWMSGGSKIGSSLLYRFSKNSTQGIEWFHVSDHALLFKVHQWDGVAGKWYEVILAFNHDTFQFDVEYEAELTDVYGNVAGT